MEMREINMPKTLEPKMPHDADYMAAWDACRLSEDPKVASKSMWEFVMSNLDLRKRLDATIDAGWSTADLKAYAWSNHAEPGDDHVTPAAWRYGVLFAITTVGRELDRILGARPAKAN